MLDYKEKEHIKDVLSQGLGINRNINFPYFLNEIDENNKKIKETLSYIERLEYNQRVLERKLDILINEISRLKR